MAFSLPQFNLLANLWTCDGNMKPADGPADFVNVPCQKYTNPRGWFDVTPPWKAGFHLEWVPPIYLRFPRGIPFAGTWPTWKVVCVEVPAGSGQYYRTVWQEIEHEGFPNEYAILVSAQCDDHLLAFPPAGHLEPVGIGADACGSGPPPPPPPPPAAFLDNFNDTPLTPITTHIADTGETYTVNTPGGQIDSTGTAFNLSGPVGFVWAIANFVGTVTTWAIDFTTPSFVGSGVYQGICFEAFDPFQFLLLRCEWNGIDWQLQFYTNSAGIFSFGPPSITFILAPNTSYHMSVAKIGTTYVASITGPGVSQTTSAIPPSSGFGTGIGVEGLENPTSTSCLVTLITAS